MSLLWRTKHHMTAVQNKCVIGNSTQSEIKIKTQRRDEPRNGCEGDYELKAQLKI